MLASILLLVLSGLLAAYFYLKYSANYFRRKCVPYIPANILFGNIADGILGRIDSTEMVNQWYNHPAGLDQPYVGMRFFNDNIILVKDPELVKQILIKDIDVFSNRHATVNASSDPLKTSLFFVKNPEWKLIRSKMTPAFSSGKIKQMFHLIDYVGKKLSSYIDKTSAQEKIPEIKYICGMFTTDVISSIAFGLELNSFKDPTNEFLRSGQSVFNFTIQRAFEFTSIFFVPKLIPLLRSKLVPERAMNIFRHIFTRTLEERRTSGVFRNDIVDILLAFQSTSQKDDSNLELTDEMLLGQAVFFFLAGFETSSITMSFTLYELACHSEIQEKLRNEIKDVYAKGNGAVTYEAINNMEYISKVLDETLRLYPPMSFLNREVTLGSDQTGYSLKPFGDFVMPQGMPVYIPAAAFHRDPKYFPNPLKYDPERFSPANKRNIVSGTYMPFGLGGRACIGQRIGLLQSKVGLFYLLKDHYVKCNAKTLSPMKLNKKALLIQAEGGIHLDFVKDI